MVALSCQGTDELVRHRSHSVEGYKRIRRLATGRGLRALLHTAPNGIHGHLCTSLCSARVAPATRADERRRAEGGVASARDCVEGRAGDDDTRRLAGACDQRCTAAWN